MVIGGDMGNLLTTENDKLLQAGHQVHIILELIVPGFILERALAPMAQKK